jgi:small conductance mechanosensitive channel
MFLLQVPGAESIAQDVTQTFSGIENEWARIWAMFMESPVDALKFLGTHALGIATKIFIALLIFWVGRWLIRRLKHLLSTIFDRRKVDSSVTIFFNYVVSAVLWILLAIVIIGVLGWSMTGLVAIFAATAFAVGMALSGTLSNFAGGILVLLLKPFRVGDYIEAQGFGGTVRNIELFNTTITTSDNKTVIMPNGALSTGIVDNVTRQPTRMAEWKITMAYGMDFDVASQTVLQALKADGRVLAEPAPVVAIGELSTAGVVMVIRAWVARADYQNVIWDMNKIYYTALPAAGADFPTQGTQIIVNNSSTK